MNARDIFILIVVVAALGLLYKKYKSSVSPPVYTPTPSPSPVPSVVPVSSMSLIGSHARNFSINGLPDTQSAAAVYTTCTPEGNMFCPPQGGQFLVQYDDNGSPRFVSYIPSMDTYNALVALGIVQGIPEVPQNAIYMGVFTPTN